MRSISQSKYTKKFLTFKNNESGNFALIFVFCLLGLMICIGAVFDYTRMSQDRANFQNAVDSGALAAAISLKKNDWDDARVEGIDQFNSNVSTQDQSNVTSIDYTYVDDVVYGTMKGNSQNYFMGLVGVKNLDYTVKAAVKFPNYPIEVAMVLDTTGSMAADGKIETLKIAAKDFVDAVLAFPNSDRKVSIVPFAQYVNVGRDKMGESWLDAKDVDTHIPEQCSTHTPIVSQSGCTTTTTNHPAQNVPEQCYGAVYIDGVEASPAGCTPAHTVPPYTSSSESCTNINYGPPVTTCVPAHDETVYWNGCVASRNHPKNLNDKGYGEQVPGPNELICPNEITALTNDNADLTAAINNITAVGSTYIPQGLVWGRRTLSAKKPYTGGRTKAEMAALNGRKFIVLMTDGANTSSPLVPASPLHNGSDIAKADSWLKFACKKAKKDDIEIYTVSFGTTIDKPTKKLLKKCASSKEHYFHAKSNEAFKETFKAIADAIVTIHLSS